ncbi:MAG: tetratricopeptide repeat protein [Verrucomicrobiota bacterium]|jgi:tetratricopeptide (TPR) repeat protein
MTESASRRQIWAISVLIAAAVLAVYWPALHCGFVNYDDPDYVTGNGAVRQGLTWKAILWAFTTTHAFNWHPVTWLSHIIDCQFYGFQPAGHHLTSLLFHAANSVLLFCLLRRMTGALWRSALVAVLFALHPLRVQSVAWISERKDVLSAFFWMLTLWAYVRYAEELKTQSAKVKGYYVAAVCFFALGLMAKPMVVTLPFVLLLLDYWPLRRGWLVTEKIPFFALSAVSCAVTFLVQDRTGAVSSLARLPFGERLANVPVAYMGYLCKTFWPTNLAVFYPHESWEKWEILGSIALLGLISGLVLWRMRGLPYLAVGWAWFLGMLVPAIGLVQVGAQSMADRYSYLPSIGLGIMMVWGIEDWTARRPVWRQGAILAGWLAVMAGALLAWRQTGVFKDTETLWRAALQAEPDCIFAHDCLGKFLAESGRLDEALEQCRQSLALRPEDPVAQNTLARIGLRQGKADEAIAHCLKSLQVEPRSEQTYYTLGQAYVNKGQMAEAAAAFEKALELQPDFAEARCNLGFALLQLGRGAEAIHQYHKALELDPDYALAHNDLGSILLQQGRADEALNHFARAARIAPRFGEAHYNMAGVLLQKGRTNEALAEYQRALDTLPNAAPARYKIADILRRQGRLP